MEEGEREGEGEGEGEEEGEEERGEEGGERGKRDEAQPGCERDKHRGGETVGQARHVCRPEGRRDRRPGVTERVDIGRAARPATEGELAEEADEISRGPVQK